MRGIDGALAVIEEVERGRFLSETLRSVWPRIEEPAERRLAALLSYLTFRKAGLWRHIATKYCRRDFASLPKLIRRSLILGAAGLIDAKNFSPAALVNALIQNIKHKTKGEEIEGGASLVNAVLHTISREAPRYVERLRSSTAVRDMAMAFGFPGWAAAHICEERGVMSGKEIIRAHDIKPLASLRFADNAERDRWLSSDVGADLCASPGAFVNSVRLDTDPFPPDVPGFSDGLFSLMSESSMLVVDALLSVAPRGAKLLDMCAGRGVKSAQILRSAHDLSAECWDISKPRIGAAKDEFIRSKVSDRAVARVCDAQDAEPAFTPDVILLDAPCTGSGTWRRHPEAKWRSSPEKLEAASALQQKLFARAADLIRPGGTIVYSTCSIFRRENEITVGQVLSSRSDLIEEPFSTGTIRSERGRPYGSVIFPSEPWVDGFYIAIFRKKG